MTQTNSQQKQVNNQLKKCGFSFLSNHENRTITDFGATAEIRTPDLLITNQLLYRTELQ